MKIAKGILIALFLVGFHHKIVAQQAQEKTVVFQVYSPDLPDTTQVFIAGSLADLGSWNPAKTAMQHEGNHRWSKKIAVQEGTSIEYKFTLGSWDREAADANGLPLQNFTLNVKGDTTVTHNILFWKNGDTKKVVTGQITGTMAYHRQLTGEGIAPRDIIVWLPPDYGINKKKRYPVVYMQDGQNSVDPATSAFGVDWRIDETSDSLIRNKITQSFIVVGIYNTADRSKEYTPGESGSAYMKFVVKKVKPLVDSVYRTKSDAKKHYCRRVICGRINFLYVGLGVSRCVFKSNLYVTCLQNHAHRLCENCTWIKRKKEGVLLYRQRWRGAGNTTPTGN
jgi:hypothetical protein